MWCRRRRRRDYDAVRLPEPSLIARHLVVSERGDLFRAIEADGHPLSLSAQFPNTALILLGRYPARPENGLPLLLCLLHAEDYTIFRTRRVTDAPYRDWPLRSKFLNTMGPHGKTNISNQLVHSVLLRFSTSTRTLTYRRQRQAPVAIHQYPTFPPSLRGLNQCLFHHLVSYWRQFAHSGT